jgi:hypothetical protein
MRYFGILLAALVAGALNLSYAYGQSAGQAITTSGGSFNIESTFTWQDRTGKLDFNYFVADTGARQDHLDYDVEIFDESGERIFSAAANINQSVIHTSEGKSIVTYDFKQNGNYVIKVTIFALGLPPIPITPESVTMPVRVTPEFPATVMVAVVATISAAIVASRLFRKA